VRTPGRSAKNCWSSKVPGVPGTIGQGIEADSSTCSRGTLVTTAGERRPDERRAVVRVIPQPRDRPALAQPGKGGQLARIQHRLDEVPLDTVETERDDPSHPSPALV
jgi:hypothetical protein